MRRRSIGPAEMPTHRSSLPGERLHAQANQRLAAPKLPAQCLERVLLTTRVPPAHRSCTPCFNGLPPIVVAMSR